MQPEYTVAETLTGFVVRLASAEDAAQIIPLFGISPLIGGKPIVYGAFGEPGNLPLGGMLVLPSNDRTVAFEVLVLPQYRRRKVGTRLVQTLFADARRRGFSRLRMATLVHQDQPENAFYRLIGFTPERSFATYTIALVKQVQTTCAPVAARFNRRNAGERGVKIVPLNQADPQQVARFFATHYGGTADHRLDQLTKGLHDAAISPVAIRQTTIDSASKVVGAALFRSRATNPTIYLDLILVDPAHRGGPLAVAMLEKMVHFSVPRGHTHLVYEADPDHDLFATASARRWNLPRQWFRYRYAIDLSTMSPDR